jgi:hypothetical protein
MHYREHKEDPLPYCTISFFSALLVFSIVVAVRLLEVKVDVSVVTKICGVLGA